MTPRAIVLTVLLLSPGVLHSDDKQVSSQELVRLGFFQDFDELVLEDLLMGSGAEVVKVTVASGREQDPSQAPGVLSVVSREDIRNLGARTLVEVLATLPGFDLVSDNLGRHRIVVRGLSSRGPGLSEGVLVLLNGHRLNEALRGGATLLNRLIPVASVERVEVLRGPGSALYGEAALAGVINIVTDDPKDLTGVHVSAGTGSFDQQQITLRLGSALRDLKLAGFISYSDTSGARLPIPADAQTLVDRTSGEPPLSLAPGRARDRGRFLETHYRALYRDWAVQWRVRQESASGFVGATDSLGTFNDITNKQTLLDVRYARPTSIGALAATFSFTQNAASELLQVVPPGPKAVVRDGRVGTLDAPIYLQTSLKTRRYAAEGALERTLGGHTLSAGVILGREGTYGLEALGNLDFRTRMPLEGETLQPLAGVVDDHARTTAAIYVQDQWGLSSSTSLTGGLRFDHLSDVGGVVASPRLALVHLLPEDVQLKVLYGRAFRAPSFQELEFELSGVTGNPGLRPVTVQTLEASLAKAEDGWEAQVSGYLSFLRNAVIPDGSPSLWAPAPLVNGSGYDLQGIEIDGRKAVGNHSLFLRYTLQSARDLDTDRPAAGVPRHLATLGGNLELSERFQLTPTWILRGSRPRAPGDARPRVAGFGLVGMSLQWQSVSRKVELSGSVQNLLDKRYSDPSPAFGVPGDYPQPGRNLFFDARYRF